MCIHQVGGVYSPPPAGVLNRIVILFSGGAGWPTAGAATAVGSIGACVPTRNVCGLVRVVFDGSEPPLMGWCILSVILALSFRGQWFMGRPNALLDAAMRARSRGAARRGWSGLCPDVLLFRRWLPYLGIQSTMVFQFVIS